MDKKETDNKPLMYAIIGFLAGALLAVLLARTAVNSNNMGMMRMMGISKNQTMQDQRLEMMEEMMEHDEGMSMNAMVGKLQNKSADDFDKTFIDLMIEHHQGAIDMANLAKTSAKHNEIKSLAADIITAQTSEIEMMRDWVKNWGY